MKPLSEMTREELTMALQSVEEEREYLLRQVGRISGQAARRYEIRINSLRKQTEEVKEFAWKGWLVAGDLSGL